VGARAGGWVQVPRPLGPPTLLTATWLRTTTTASTTATTTATATATVWAIEQQQQQAAANWANARQTGCRLFLLVNLFRFNWTTLQGDVQLRCRLADLLLWCDCCRDARGGRNRGCWLSGRPVVGWPCRLAQSLCQLAATSGIEY